MDNLKVRGYRNEDYEKVMEWLIARNMPAIPQDILPNYGFIIDDVCCGFLYRTDSSYGFLEHFITNPSANVMDRHAGVELIADDLILLAEGLGLKYLGANTTIPSIGKIAARNGFKFVGNYLTYFRSL